MANDPYWNNVVLAMHMDDAGLTDLKGHAVTLNGNASRSATQSKFGGYSAYFDGTGDYLSLANSTDWNLGNVFTIEAFVYFLAIPATAYSSTFVRRWDSAVSKRSTLFHLRNPSGTVLLSAGVSADGVTDTAIVETAWTPTLSRWYHLAFVHTGTTLILFVDGVSVATQATTASCFATDSVFNIGATNASVPSGFLNGHIDDLRITKGVARYTANFTVPTTAFPDTPPQLSGTVKDASGNFASRPVAAYKRGTMALASAGISDATTGAFTLPAYDGTPHSVVALPVEGDPYWDRTVLAMHMDGANGSTTFTDEKGHTVTPTTTVLSTADKKFGTASLYYDGVAAGNVITASSADFALGGDFTIEGWFKPATDCPTCYALSSNTSFAANTWILEPTHATNPGKWCFFMHGIAVAGGPLVSVSNSLTNQWTHVAITKQGAVYRMFINGVLEAMYVNAAAMSANASDAIYINGAAAGRYKGYIDDVRITKGVARYIHDFTPPSSPFPHAIAGGTENAIILDNITPV